MYEGLCVTWRVTPLQPPLLRRHCSRCSKEMPFACSTKFRTNAQKKRIDVWLIYRCSGCDEVWNLPIFERVTVGDMPPGVLGAIARDDPAVALRSAFDRRLLERHGGHAEDCPDAVVAWQLASGQPGTARTAEITVQLAVPWRARLDRFLAEQLHITRTSLACRYADGQLAISPPARNALRRSIVDGQRIDITLGQDAVGMRLRATIRDRIAFVAA